VLDPESLRTCIPGVESLTETSPDHWDTVMKVGVAAIKGTYKGKIAIIEKQAPLVYTLQVEGSGGPGFVKGTAKISLEAQGADATTVKVEGDGQVGGMLAGVGQRMLVGVSKRMAAEFFGNVDAALGAVSGWKPFQRCVHLRLHPGLRHFPGRSC